MNTYKRDLFLKEFAEMIDSMVDYEHFSRERLVDNLCRMARLFRLTKVITEFYKNITDEKDGKGEVLCDFDEGPAEVVVMKKEIIPGAIILVILSVVLTFIGGLIPVKKASRKDPVLALRTE